MRKIVLATSLALVALGPSPVARVGPLPDRVYLVPTFQPAALGNGLVFSGRPADMSVDPTGATLAVKTSHGIVFVDTKTNRVTQTLALPKLDLDFPTHLGGNAPAGILWRGTTRVWETDAFDAIHEAQRNAAGRFSWVAAIHLPLPSARIVMKTDKNAANTIGAAPIGLLRRGPTTFWVTLSRSNAVGLVNERARRVVRQIPVGIAPFGLAASKGKLYVTNWGGAIPRAGAPSAYSSGSRVSIDPKTGVANSGSVTVIDTRTNRVLTQIVVGLHPSAIAASESGDDVYVANTSSDSIGVIDTKRDRVVQTISLDGTAPPGTAPNALALDSRDRKLFVAEGGADRVLAIDLKSGKLGLSAATMWYPSALALVGRRLYVANLKGVGSRSTSFGLPAVVARDRAGGYNVYDWAGTLQELTSADWTKTQIDTPPVENLAILPHLFRHVVYVIKENHTYDDIYGDVETGNGDKKLCLFCGRITPNQHALAMRFGLFDNFYVNGVLSADGHNWADEGYATDYLERSLSGWARSYPSAGGDPLAYSPSGFIWNRVVSAGLEFRDYGEFIPDVSEFSFDGKSRKVSWSEVNQDYLRGTHRIAWKQKIDIDSLRPFVDVRYPSFSLKIPDQYRASEFIRELAGYSQKGRLPSLMTVVLPNDHTAYTSPGYPRPDAFAADNDLALGRVVSAVSHSRFWNDTVIFVVEDDAQDGTDHVDGHRTAALVISAHNRSGFVDSRFYNQTSILRTIELILGLKPMTRFDATAPPIVAAFDESVTQAPFDAVSNQIPIDALNPPLSALSAPARQAALVSLEMSGKGEDREDAFHARAILHQKLSNPSRVGKRSAQREVRTR